MNVIAICSLIPFVALAFVLARRAFRTESFWETLAIVPVLSLGCILLFVGLIGRVIRDFPLGIFWGGLLSAGIVAVVFLSLRRNCQPLRFRLEVGLRDLSWILLVVLTSGLVAMVSLKYSIYDEVRLQAHLPVVESILRGNFPPSFTAFPEIPYRYHYGFNLIAAYFSLAFGLPGYLGVDLATLLSWVSFIGVFLFFLKLLMVPRAGWTMALALVTLTGGLSWLLSKNDPGMGALFQIPHWQQMFVLRRGVHPHFMMYFFQHPMGLGIGLFLATILLFKTWFERKSPWALAVGVAILAALSLAQIMLFLTLLAALGLVFAYYLVRGSQTRLETLFVGLLVGGVALLGAFALGGFLQFSSDLENQPIIFSWPPSYLRYEYWGSRFPLNWTQGLTWYLSGFGLILFLIPILWVAAIRKRQVAYSLLAVFSILCFLVPLFFRYSYSWDIIKWYFGFEFSGKLLMAALVVPWALRSWARYFCVTALVGFSMITPLKFLTDLAFKHPRSFTRAELRIAAYGQPRLEGPLKSLVERVLADPDPWGMVWASLDTSLKISLFTGLPTLQMDQNTYAMPVSREKIRTREEWLKRLDKAPDWETLRLLRVKWVAFTCGEVKFRSPEWKAFLEEMKGRPEVQDLSVDAGRRGCIRAFRIWDSVEERRRSVNIPDF